MSNTNKCPFHPKYKAIHKPRNTHKHPEGCKECWEIYNFKNRMEEVKKNVMANVLLNNGLVPGKIYNLNTITASYKQSDDVDVYDVKNLKSLNNNINLMFLRKEKVKHFGTKTSDNKRLIEEYEMLTFTSGQEKYFIFENKENLCKLIS